MDDSLHYADFMGERKILPELDDLQVKQVFETHEFIELSTSSENALLQGNVIPGAWMWAFPLLVGEELIGVIKIENLHIGGASLRKFLPVFFHHAALILSNEIRNAKRAKAEAELQSYQEHLEQLVEARTMELEAAKNAAETANRAKSVFLSNMSHELRTPLNAILGFAQLMERDSAMSAEHRSELQTINRSGRHLLALINDVLEISRIEAGRTQLAFAPFDLNEMLMAICDIVRIRADSKGLIFRVERHGTLPQFVLGDEHHLRQVLINLLNNAVKYTDQGEVVLHLTPIADGICFAICDTGAGIAKTEQESVFHAFYQTEHGIAKGEGTGLGLAISQEFVKLMGSEISVESEVGRGSTFAFVLQLPTTDAPENIRVPQHVLELLSPKPVRVLVAEDNPDSRFLITHLLESVGFEVRAAENGQEAELLFQSFQPHFIWMDMRMPIMDGYQATRAIRALPEGDKVKIVALTASAFTEDRTAIIEAGCDEMLTKPFNDDQIFDVMRQLLALEYRYAQQNTSQTTDEHTEIDLRVFDENLRAELRQAAELLDMEAIFEFVEKIKGSYPQQANWIQKAAAEFHLEQIYEAMRD
jgi:signal transduction histidine kinase/DNA-binding response OmpR family regulator